MSSPTKTQKLPNNVKAGNSLNRGITKRISSIKDPEVLLQEMKLKDNERLIKECVDNMKGLK